MSSDEKVAAATLSGADDPLGLKIYCRMLDTLLLGDSPMRQESCEQARRLLAELAPRDAIEKMMVDQILWLHARLAHLSFYSSVQTRLKPMQVMHEACDRLADTIRRHIVAFSDYRDPGRRRFTAVKQANIAQQQIVAGPLSRRRRRWEKPQPQMYPKVGEREMTAILNELFPKRKKRRYRLSKRGLAGLRRSIRETRPWSRSAGPITALGKKRSSQNALKHGLFSREFVEERNAYISAWRAAMRGK
jgi:hypothetical protein